MTKKQWQYLLLLPALLLALSGCGSSSDDDTNKDNEDPLRAQTFGEATLNATRRGAAPLVEFDTTYKYDYFLGVYRYAVTQGDNIIGTVKMPDDKDYDLYFYDTSGNRVAFVETQGKGEDETLSYTVGDFTTLYVVVYDPDADEDSTTEYELLMRKSEQVSEVEPNDLIGTAQVITGSYVSITGTLPQSNDSNNSNDDADDFYSFNVNEGDTINVSAEMTFSESGIAGFYLYTNTDQNNYAASTEFNADSAGTQSGSFTYTIGTGVSSIFILANQLLTNVSSYSMTVDIIGQAIDTPANNE